MLGLIWLHLGQMVFQSLQLSKEPIAMVNRYLNNIIKTSLLSMDFPSNKEALPQSFQ
jgi:hypothetical protein